MAAESRVKAEGFFALALPGGLPQARLGLVMSRKAARRAVDRNRAKRLAREVFRESRQYLPPADIVLRLRNDLRSRGNENIRAELNHLLDEVSKRAIRQRAVNR